MKSRPCAARAVMTLLALCSAARGARAENGDWSHYPIIVWQDQTPARAAGLRRLGITAGRVFGVRGPVSAEEASRRIAPLVSAGLRCYIENIATDFYAAYHRWQPDHPVTWAFDQVRAQHAQDPQGLRAFRRSPGLSDEQALAAVRQRLAEHVRMFAPYRPLYYSLGDETGIADLAAAWDFDLSAASLTQMRQWLRGRYGTLAALNQQWDRDFDRWEQVVPMTTDQATHVSARDSADNFSAWADFKEWTDEAFARAVRAGTQAVHAADPDAEAAIEGAQIPGWGGYDYARLAPAVDVMEIYDSGNNTEIARSLNPRLKVLTTTAPSAHIDLDRERGRLWHELLLGNRGLVVWDEARALVDDHGRATATGRAFAALFRAFGGGLAARIGASSAPPAPVAILYSPSSFRIDWLLDRRQEGGDWTTRSAEIEGQDSPLRAAMRQAASLLAHLGLPPRWITEDGLHGDMRVLLLPHAIALSDPAIAAIRGFVRRGGLVLADTEPGVFDGHGRRRAAPPLAGAVAIVSWPESKGGDDDAARLAGLAARLRQAGAVAPVSLRKPDGTIVADIDARVFRDGDVTILGLQRDPASTGREAVVLTMARSRNFYDMLGHRSLGRTRRITLSVGAIEPKLLAITPVRSGSAEAATVRTAGAEPPQSDAIAPWRRR